MPRWSFTTRSSRVAAGVLAVITLGAVPAALAAGEGDPLLGGVRNPTVGTGQELRSETEIIARNSTYGTRQSNLGSGGGAIYGCRSDHDDEACVRANNLREGRAFDFETNGPVAGSFRVGDSSNQPFTTNGTGQVENLHADRVDGSDAPPIFARMAAGADETVLRIGPLRVSVRCDVNANPTLSANTTATTSVIHAIAHDMAGGGDNRAADADFRQGETFVAGFTPSSSGVINYIDEQGSVSAQLMTQRVGNTCVIGGAAQGGPNFDR